MFDFLRSLRGRTAPGQKRSRVGPLIALHEAGRPVWTPRDYVALSREGYERNPVVHRCIRLIAEAAAQTPLVAKVGSREMPEHPALALIERPNPRQGGIAFREMLVGHLLVAGNAYVEAVSAGREPRELYALRPDRMRVVPGRDGWPEAYDYTVGGDTVRFRQDEGGLPPILHLTLFHPVDDHYGLSPIEPAAVSLDIHNAAGSWHKALLDNAARPSGALVYDGPEGATLAENVFDTSEMSAEHVVAVLKKFVWSTKRKLAGLPVTNHLMPVILGPQGSGKSTFVHRFLEPMAELMATTDFDQITDKRNIDLWKNYVLFLDEMAHAQRADIDAVKNAITASSLSRRPMRENSTEIVSQNATFIGCSNKELSQLVVDTTGNRRFFPLRMPATACRDTVNLIDPVILWRSVDLHAADPMDGFRDETATIQAKERSLSSVERWLADFSPKARHGVNASSFEELVRGNRIGANDLFKLFSEWEAVHHPSGYRLNVQNFGSEMNRLMKNSPAAVPFKRGPRTSAGNTYEYTGQTVLKVVV